MGTSTVHCCPVILVPNTLAWSWCELHASLPNKEQEEQCFSGMCPVAHGREVYWPLLVLAAVHLTLRKEPDI